MPGIPNHHPSAAAPGRAGDPSGQQWPSSCPESPGQSENPGTAFDRALVALKDAPDKPLRFPADKGLKGDELRTV